MRPHLLAAAAALTLLATAANASTIAMQTRAYGGGALGSAMDYATLIDGLVAAPATPGYGDATPALFEGLNNQTTIGGPSGGYAAKFTIALDVPGANAGTWAVRFGVDFGLGGAVFVDGVAVAFSTNDMWWGGGYGDPAQHLSAGGFTLAPGAHTVTVYGLEGCCDGGMQGQFLAHGATGWATFGTGDGFDAAAVPAPAGLAVFGVGLLGLAAAYRRRAG